MPFVSFEQVSKRFGETSVIKDLGRQVADGELFSPIANCQDKLLRSAIKVV